VKDDGDNTDKGQAVPSGEAGDSQNPRTGL